MFGVLLYCASTCVSGGTWQRATLLYVMPVRTCQLKIGEYPAGSVDFADTRGTLTVSV